MKLSVLSFVSLLIFAPLARTWGEKYILVPKESHVLLNVDFDALAYEHQLTSLARIGSLSFYTTTGDNLEKYKSTLAQFYEVEQDAQVWAWGDQVVLEQHTVEQAPWHLARIVQKGYPMYENVSYPFNATGSCHRNGSLVNTYIVDTGIDVAHSQFEGRAVWGANLVDDNDTDCNSHGTHVAGIVGSKNWGVCVDANLHAVKVLDCDGSGSISGVIAGIQWVYEHHTAATAGTKSIVNMSLGGGRSSALDRAIDSFVQNSNGVFFVVAAGNENSDACKGSPSRLKSVVTVMASDRLDNKAWFSNWGTCADIYAPGVDVTSTVPGEKHAKFSGTSMASPVVAGVLNHYISRYSDAGVKMMLERSTSNVIKKNEDSSPNRLVFLGN